MLLGIVSAYQVWICICIIFEVSAEWELSCYNESLHIQCGAEKSIVIHEAHFGYFRDILLVSNSTKKCRSHNAKDCWIDVTANISRRCSGHSLCKSSVHYSSELSAELLSRECSFISDNLAEPTLFVEYECISTTLITRISNENHVDPDQIGGYLISLDYNEIIQSGSEWRSHLADAMCGAPTVNNHLPHRFYLPAPKLSTTRQSSIHHHHNDNDNNNADDSSLFNKGILATFILRIKDIGLTKSSNVNMMPSASSSSTSSRTSISNNNNNNHDLILATGPACPSDPGKACHHDYLSIDARVSSSYNSTEIIIPIVRFCLVNSTAKTSASSSQSAGPTAASTSSSSASSASSMSFPSFSFSSSSIPHDNDYQKLFPVDETHLVGQVYGPISNAFGLQFTSNLNLLDPYIIHGKGIMLEYIALLCVPINPPSGNGIVDYRFRTNPHTSHTFAYAEIFCPSDRWLEPTDPGLDDVYSGIIHTPTTNIKNHSDNNAWWLERRRHVTLICDHHERKWTPNRLPEACLTSDELTTFVAQITKKLQESKSSMPNEFSSDNNTLNGANITSISSSSSSSLKAVDNGDEEDAAAARNGYTYQATHISSVVLGSILGVLVLILAVLLVVYSLRHKLFDQYHKTVNLAAISSSSRLGSSSLTTFNRSKDTLLFPTFKKSSYNTLVTNGNHRNLFKSYPHLISHQTIMNESVPDLPTRPQQLLQSSVPLAQSAATTRTTALHSSMITGMNKKTSNIDLMRGNGGYLPPWRNSLKNNHSNIINTPVTPNAISALTLVPNTPGSEHRQMMTSLPWLRTNSSTHITTNIHNNNNNKSMTNQNGSSSNNNNNSAFGASSETMLFSSLNIPNGLPRSWWLPWRKSMRKKRRLYTQLQRRQEIQSSLSQRGLLESSNMLDNKSTPHLRNSSYLMTSSNGFLISEPSRSGGPMPPLPPIPQSATSSKREEVSHSFAAKQPPLPQQLRIKPDGGTGSERVKTTLITNDGNNFGGVCSTLYTNQDPMNSPTSLMLYTNYQSKMTPDEQSMLNTSTIYPNKANSNHIQSFPSSSSTASSWMNMVNNNGADNDLPWKFTPPNRNSFSNGIRRLSSFFRSFHQSNGSFTPPRNFSASFKKSSYRSSSFNTRSEMPSMPTLPTFNHRTTSNMSNNNHNSNNNDINNSSNNYINHTEQPMVNHDSFRLLSGRHITHPLMQSSSQALSESSDLHKKHTRAYNLWSNQTVKPSLFQQDGYNSFNVYGSSGDEHTTIGDMLSGSRNTTKTSLQGSSRLDSLLSTELIDLCGAATTTAAGSGGALNKDDPFMKGNTTSTTLKDPNSVMYNNNNRFDYIEKDQINQSPYITTTDPYLEPVSLKRRQQNLITNQINNNNNNIDHNNNNRNQTNGKINGDTGINTNYDLLKGNKPDQHAIHSGTSSAISSLVFADDCDIISKVSENSLNKSDQYSELHRLTPQTSNKSIVSNPTPVAPAPPPPPLTSTNAAHKTANPPTNILNIPQFKHDIPTIDYVTYDEARSSENNLLIQNKRPVKQSIKSPPSVDYKSNNNNNDDDDAYYAQNILKSNETILSSRSSIMPEYSQMKRRRSTIKSCDSRPLSDAMISNHYYDLNKNTNYQDISMISPSQPQAYSGDGDNNIPSAIKSHPPLPPLWSNNNDRNFGSVDSLYETVDLPKTNSGIPTMAPKTATAMAHMIQRPSLMPSSMNTNYAERCKMALPPTPNSFSIKAPVRSIGEMDDWNLPGSDDSDDDDDNLGS